MKNLTANRIIEFRQQIKCIGIFFLICIVPLALANWFSENRLVFHIILFIDGWLTWTFIEYILHRFWNHSKSADKQNAIVQRHLHHHTHPTEIKVTGKQRLAMVLIGFVLISISSRTDNFITFLAGIWIGFFWFFMMHYFLHQRWSKKVFPRLLEYHITHHCKEPDRCFGISCTCWDLVFGTGPSSKKLISEKVTAFYFKGHKHD
ncbi:MAG: hypothetical protein C5B59_02775 [Bacteroidetes bacterium]|nr:MAG: hypothetical protein C5B59_02775 [Bacteroidota bacterium]